MIEHLTEIQAVLEHMPDSFGSIDDWQEAGFGPTFSYNRDTDVLWESNYQTVLKTFGEKYEKGEDFLEETYNHWAVGWVTHLVVRVLDCKCEVKDDRIVENCNGDYVCVTCNSICTVSDIFKECLELKTRLEEYPVLDDDDYCRREYEDFLEYLAQHVGDEKAADLYTYLYETYQISRPDECSYEWIQEWRDANENDD